MIALVLAEPAPWTEALLAAIRQVGPTRVFAPWALPGAHALLPARVRRFAERRTLEGVDAVPAWTVGEAALAAWARGRTDRQIRARFATRRWVGALARRWLPPDTRMVVAPALAARELFSQAPHAVHVLLEDLPSIRELHLALDRAAADHPEQAFLRRFRAPARTVARQEAERVLAEVLVVRNRDAWARAEARGQVALAFPRGAAFGAPPAPGPRGDRVLLAGLAAARSGSVAARALLEALPTLTLLVRGGEGADPALLQHPRAREATRSEREQLEGVALVIAPALCETGAREIEQAARAGIPVVATSQAAGLVDLTRAGQAVAAGDAQGLIAAVQAWLGRRVTPSAAAPGEETRAFAEALRAIAAERAAGAVRVRV